MIYLDKDGFPVDRSGDGGDSSMRAGMLALFDVPEGHQMLITHYEKFYTGKLCRHPHQVPWNNCKNFTRDQLVPLLAGFYAREHCSLVRRVFWQTVKRKFFGQNSERDHKGSKKHIYPHQFYRDSKPDATTMPMKFNWRKFKFETTLTSNEEHEVEYKYFDFPDLLHSPDLFWHFILCGRIWYFYWFRPLGRLGLFASIYLHARSSHKEHNQIIAQVKIAGAEFVRYFKAKVPSWKEDLRQYWGSRSEIKYAEAIIEDLERY